MSILELLTYEFSDSGTAVAVLLSAGTVQAEVELQDGVFGRKAKVRIDGQVWELPLSDRRPD